MIIMSRGNLYVSEPLGLPAPAPTTSPASRPTSAPEGGVAITHAPGTVRRGAMATVAVRAMPGAECSILVRYKSGPSQARGLGAEDSRRQWRCQLVVDGRYTYHTWLLAGHGHLRWGVSTHGGGGAVGELWGEIAGEWRCCLLLHSAPRQLPLVQALAAVPRYGGCSMWLGRRSGQRRCQHIVAVETARLVSALSRP